MELEPGVHTSMACTRSMACAPEWRPVIVRCGTGVLVVEDHKRICADMCALIGGPGCRSGATFLCSDYALSSASSVRAALHAAGAIQSPTRFSTGGQVPSGGMSS